MIKIICASLIIMLAVTSRADQDMYLYSLKRSTKLSGVIGQSVANRIEFGLLGFREIIGDESEYTFITDQNNKSIFLTPKVRAGKNIALSLVNQAGEIIDLNLSVQNIEGQVIKIDKKISDLEFNNLTKNNEVISMIKAMQKDSDSNQKYYITHEPRDIAGNLEGIKLTQDRTYKYGNLVGSRIVVTNLTKNPRELHPYEFKNLYAGLHAVSIRHKVLKAKQKGIVYVITGEKSDD